MKLPFEKLENISQFIDNICKRHELIHSVANKYLVESIDAELARQVKRDIEESIRDGHPSDLIKLKLALSEIGKVESAPSLDNGKELVQQKKVTKKTVSKTSNNKKRSVKKR